MSYPWHNLEVNTLDLAPVVPDGFLGCVLDGELYLLSFVDDAVLKHQLILQVVGEVLEHNWLVEALTLYLDLLAFKVVEQGLELDGPAVVTDLHWGEFDVEGFHLLRWQGERWLVQEFERLMMIEFEFSSCRYGTVVLDDEGL